MRAGALKRRAVVCELASLGLTRRQICASTSTSYPFVVNVLRAAGVTMAYDTSGNIDGKAKTKERAGTMAELYAKGSTLAQIGEVFGVTRERVRQMISKHFGMNAKSGGQTVTAARHRMERAAARDAKSLAKYGCTSSQYREIPVRAKRAYGEQKRNAATRKIAWQFTLWQWWNFWLSSGHWNDRGRGFGRFVMCRRGDVGPYSPGNVFIATCEQNISEGNRRFDLDLPIGVRRTADGGFACRRNRADLGTYRTAEEASAAYQIGRPLDSRLDKRRKSRQSHGLPNGVSLNTKGTVKPYRAYFYIGRKQQHIGSFASVAEAVAARAAAMAPEAEAA